MSEHPLPPEIASLVQAWLEGSLDSEQAAALDAVLTTRPELKDALLLQLSMDAMLRETCSANQSAARSLATTTTAEVLAFPTDATPAAPLPRAAKRFSRRRLAGWLALAAAIALTGVPFVREQLAPIASVGAFSGPVAIERDGSEFPAQIGTELRAGDTLHTRVGARAEMIFRRERTRITLEPRTRLAVQQVDNGKSFNLRHGTIHADVSPQRAQRPVNLVTSRAYVTVKGTRFTLAARFGATWLKVDEGLVEISNYTNEEPTTVVVGAGQFAVAAPDVLLQPRPANTELDQLSSPLEIDFEEGVSTGIGGWEPVPGGVRPTDLALFPDERRLSDGWIDPRKPKVYSFFYLPVSVRGSFRVTAAIDVESVTSDTVDAGNLNLWRFGFGLRYPHREVSLRMNQRPEGGMLQTRVIKPEWRRFVPEPTSGNFEAPFNVAVNGRYRLKWEIRRQSPSRVRLMGKIWPSDTPEPDAWNVDTIADGLEGDLGAINLDTYRAICAFHDFKAELLP